MNKQLSIQAKLAILVVFAVMFAATMIALSVRTHNKDDGHSAPWGSDKKIEKTFSVQPNGKLILDADEGTISISGTESNEVSVQVTARGSDDQLRKFNVTFDQEGDRVKVEGRLRNHHFNFFENNSINVHFEIQVPKKFNLDVQTAGGDIVVQNIEGTIEGETSGGDLELTKVGGSIKMNTSGGNITVQNATGSVFLETSGGNMRGESINGTIHMETSGGNIELKDSDGKLDASTSGGNIRVAMKDNKGIDLSTSGGNLVVRLPKSISAEVLAEATGGEVSCDFPFAGKLRDGSLRGTINGGGNPIKLETSGGDIVISSVE
ncbi:MAG: DUF4097 family beta strand repeat protein [Ignavibacteria bacterium]|nr:DUF4097 family beta strand repeat protein [Ignavibacteria bacterium]